MEAIGINLPGLITQLVSFVILFILLKIFLYKPILRMLDQRSERIRESLEAAERAQRESAESQQEVQAQLEAARAEGQQLVAPPEDWAFEVNTNLLGTIHCTRAALDPMVAQGGGKIVNISSDAGRVGEFRQAVYSGAKAGIIGFSKAVAREVGRSGIHVNVVCPGYTKTPGTAGQLDPELEARIAKSYPLRKLGLPDDVARMAVFLASEGASHITGQTISVSGGYSMV